MNESIAQKAFVIRILVTVLAVGCALHTVFFKRPGTFPFSMKSRGTYSLIIEPEQGRALPTGLRAGDRLDRREQTLATRAALQVSIRPGETYTFLIHRGEQRLNIPVTTVPAQLAGGLYVSLFIGFYSALMLVLGLATLWWGSDWIAWGVSIFAHGVIFNDFLNIALPSVTSLAASILKDTVSIPLIIVGLYITAFTLAGTGLTRRIRWFFHSILTLVLAAEVTVLDINIILPLVYGTRLQLHLPFMVLYIISLFIPVVMLFTGYTLMDMAQRVRLRWVLWSLTLFVAAIAWHSINLSVGLLHQGLVEQIVWNLIFVGTLTGLIYGLLFKRLVTFSFVINRALVYSFTAIAVVAIFALLGALVQIFAIGGNPGFALTLGVSLIVGLSLEAVKSRIDILIERLFFRRKFLAENALRQFTRQCAFLERSEHLLDQATANVHKYLQAPSVALYEQDEDGYVRVRQRGANRFPERIDIDDWAFVMLRAETAETDLSTIETILGEQGYAFPMAVRGRVQGALVVAARLEHYTPNERELLADVAQQVSAALHALRARDNEKLIRALASGTVKPAIARERARKLYAIELKNAPNMKEPALTDGPVTSTEG